MTASPAFFISAWLLMHFAGIADTEVGIRPLGYSRLRQLPTTAARLDLLGSSGWRAARAAVDAIAKRRPEADGRPDRHRPVTLRKRSIHAPDRYHHWS